MLGLTQQEMADSIGVSKQYFSKVENGLTDLSKEKAVLLCRKHNISLNWLLLDEGDIFTDRESIDFVNSVIDMQRFEMNLLLFSLYINESYKMIKNKYPNSSINNIVDATKELYSCDIAFDWDIQKYAEIIEEFKNRGRIYKLFKERIFRAYCRVYSKNQNNESGECGIA